MLTVDHQSWSRYHLSRASLQQLSKLRILNCHWLILRQLDDGSANTQPHSLSFDIRADMIPLDFDITSILPPSLERLYIHGLYGDFTKGQWEGFKKSLTNLEVTLPNLKKLRIQRSDRTTGVNEVIGNAKHPPDLDRIFPGSLIRADAW